MYLVTHNLASTVAPVQVPVDHAGKKDVRDMMAELLTHMEKLEAGNARKEERVSGKKLLERSQLSDNVGRQRGVTCYRCGQEGNFARGCTQLSKRNHQIRETGNPWGEALPPRRAYIL